MEAQNRLRLRWQRINESAAALCFGARSSKIQRAVKVSRARQRRRCHSSAPGKVSRQRKSIASSEKERERGRYRDSTGPKFRCPPPPPAPKWQLWSLIAPFICDPKVAASARSAAPTTARVVSFSRFQRRFYSKQRPWSVNGKSKARGGKPHSFGKRFFFYEAKSMLLYFSTSLQHNRATDVRISQVFLF